MTSIAYHQLGIQTMPHLPDCGDRLRAGLTPRIQRRGPKPALAMSPAPARGCAVNPKPGRGLVWNGPVEEELIGEPAASEAGYAFIVERFFEIADDTGDGDLPVRGVSQLAVTVFLE
jgi:hypothetical protein